LLANLALYGCCSDRLEFENFDHFLRELIRMVCDQHMCAVLERDGFIRCADVRPVPLRQLRRVQGAGDAGQPCIRMTVWSPLPVSS